MSSPTKVAAAASRASSQAQIKQFDNLRTLLRNSKNTAGTDLYQHLVDVVNHIVLHCPDEGLDKFEEISYLIKNKESIDMNEFLKITGDNNYSKPDVDMRELTIKYIQKAKKIFEVIYLLFDYGSNCNF